MELLLQHLVSTATLLQHFYEEIRDKSVDFKQKPQ
jgi:hypothetical protein